MLDIFILILLNIFLYFQIKKFLYKYFIKAKDHYEGIREEYNKLSLQNSELKNELAILTNNTEETIALYDITKEICKSLDEVQVFNNFCGQVKKYIRIGDCKFVKGKVDLSEYHDYAVVPLKIEEHFIGELLVSGVREQDKEKFHILAQQFFLGVKRAILYQRVQELAITDSLTGIFSRRYLMERLNEEIERSQRLQYNFSILMIDIDYFKDYNDRYGHLVGDAILKEVSKTIKENIRQIDLLGRYGGEEFSIALAETDKEGAKFAAERIRFAIESKDIRVYDENLKATISIGISTFPEDGSSINILIDKADQALYKAKQEGRNRVCVHGQT